MAATFAVASDLSEIIETADGFGIFKTRLEALNAQIRYLEGERSSTAEKLAEAKRLRRREIAKEENR